MTLKITFIKLKIDYRRAYKINCIHISMYKFRNIFKRVISKCLHFVIFLYFLWGENIFRKITTSMLHFYNKSFFLKRVTLINISTNCMPHNYGLASLKDRHYQNDKCTFTLI